MFISIRSQRITCVLSSDQDDVLYICQQASRFKSKFITAEIALLFSESDSEEEFEGFSDVEEEVDKGYSEETQQVWSFFFFFLSEYISFRIKSFLSVYFQMLDSEKDSDVDTGFYSDDEEASPSKRRSLLVALKYVCVYKGEGGRDSLWLRTYVFKMDYSKYLKCMYIQYVHDFFKNVSIH